MFIENVAFHAVGLRTKFYYHVEQVKFKFCCVLQSVEFYLVDVVCVPFSVWEGLAVENCNLIMVFPVSLHASFHLSRVSALRFLVLLFSLYVHYTHHFTTL
jgi:hypothetical protein